MTLRNTSDSYGSIAKFFHWLIFLLLLTNITFGFFLEDVPKDYQPITYNIHKLIGLSILTLLVLRFIWALMNPKPYIPNAKPWERAAERVVHGLLYLVVAAMPLTGWVGSVAAGRAPHIGDFRFDLPIQENKALVDTCFELHEFLAFALITLFCIHVGAALYHHYIKKDNVLRRMLPGGTR